MGQRIHGSCGEFCNRGIRLGTDEMQASVVRGGAGGIVGPVAGLQCYAVVAR